MAIKNGKPNPLNYFNLRKVDFPAHHFYYITFPKYSPVSTKGIDAWIYANLNGRYYIGQGLELDKTNSIIYITRVGFEQEKEISFFKIACPNLFR
jgi:hypothetical protein